MIRYGLIGYPLSHSWSGSWFTEKLHTEGKSAYRYVNFPLASLEEFPGLFRNHPGLRGLNVTIPYKVKIIPWLEELDEKAEKIGAVNTILIHRERGNIHMKGFNTDADGFLRSADFSGHRNALILGTGGAARAVAFALEQLGITFRFVSRKKGPLKHLTYREVTKEVVKEHTLIINATPLGMYPLTGSLPPIPYEYLSKRNFLYDLIYNPEMTAFLNKGSERGTRIQNGLHMLHCQAELSYRLWNED